MIEIELKYKLKDFPIIAFSLIKEIKEEDIYYDTKEYNLLKSGNFLRIRNGKKIDFKLNTNDLTHLYCEEKRFLTNPFPALEIENILRKLNIDIPCKTLEELQTNLIPLAKITKHRRQYKIEENIFLVLDEIKNLGYFLEIEIDIEKDSITKEEAEIYKEKLENILKDYNLINTKTEKVNIGYVELYLKKYDQEAFNLGIYK